MLSDVGMRIDVHVFVSFLMAATKLASNVDTSAAVSKE